MYLWCVDLQRRKLLKDYKKLFKNDGFERFKFPDCHKRQRPTPRPPFLFSVHTQQSEPPKAMTSTVSNSMGTEDCAHSFIAPLSQRDLALYSLVSISLGKAFQSQFARTIMFEPHKILLSKTVITPFDRGENRCPKSEVNSE